MTLEMLRSRAFAVAWSSIGSEVFPVATPIGYFPFGLIVTVRLSFRTLHHYVIGVVFHVYIMMRINVWRHTNITFNDNR